MLTEKTLIDQILVADLGVVTVRQSRVIESDGVEVARVVHRTSLMPGQDVSAQPANVQSICAAAWTPAVIAAHKAAQAHQQ
jgi:hypothetical protein